MAGGGLVTNDSKIIKYYKEKKMKQREAHMSHKMKMTKS